MALSQFQPLAQRPLCTPHIYTDDYRVPIQLDEPLWVSMTDHQLSAEVTALCLLLDTTMSSLPQSDKQDIAVNSYQKKVSFENKSAKVAAMLTQLRELLNQDNCREEDDILEYLKNSGQDLIFPRVELYLQEADQQLTSVPTLLLDNYLAQLTALHNTVTMAQQLQDDILTSGSHKYIAHQLAILHQCVNSLGAPMADYKKLIEGNFQSIKSCCTSPLSTSLPRLTHERQQWLLGLTSSLVELATSFKPDLTANLPPVVQTLNIN